MGGGGGGGEYMTMKEVHDCTRILTTSFEKDVIVIDTMRELQKPAMQPRYHIRTLTFYSYRCCPHCSYEGGGQVGREPHTDEGDRW